MAIPTIQEAINRGSVSIYLAGNNNAKGALFGKRLAAPGSMTTIAMVTDALSWGYDGGAQTEESLRQTANYLVWLCGSYGQQAQYILEGNGGGSVVPGGGGTVLPLPEDFEITSSSSPLSAGESSVTLTAYIGYNVIFTRSGITQSTVDNGGTYYSWNRDTGLFQCFPAAALTEIFTITPVG